jgi:hypothetical protein
MLVDATLPVPASLMALLAGLAPLFTAPSFRTFCGLACGFLAQTAKRTVCGMLAGAGLASCWSHDRAHWFFSRARWSPDELGLAVAKLVVALLVPAGEPVVVAIDDTLFRRRGKKVRAASWFHDGSAPGPAKTGYGNNWVVAAVVVRLPALSRPVAIPVLAKLVIKDTSSASRLWLARRMAEAIAGVLPGRAIHVVADSAYAGGELKKLPSRVTWTTRLRKDAALYELPPARTGRRGRPREKGDRLPSLATLAATAAFTQVIVTRYGKTTAIQAAPVTCLWHSVFGTRPVTAVLIRDKSKTGYDLALVTTDAAASAVQVIERYAARWSVEIGHRCCRSSWIQVSFLSFLSVVCRFSGFFLGWRPAGAVVVAGRAVPALAELVQLFLVGEDDPVPAAGASAGGDPAAVDPVVDAGGGHAELGGQVRDGPLARVEVREDGGAALGVLADAVLVDDVEDLLGGEDRGALGRPVPFGVQRAGDLRAVAPGAGEFRDAGAEGGVVRELVQAADGPDGLPAGAVPAGPGDVHVHDLAAALDGHGHVLDQDPQQFLAVGRGGRRRGPHCREVGGQGPDRVAFGVGQDGGLLLGEPLVLALQTPGLGERFLPAGLELPGDEPVLRVGELVLAPGPVRGVAGPLDALPPQLVQGGALVLGLRGGGHRHFECRGGDRVQELPGDVGVEGRAGVCWQGSPVP